MRSRSESCLLLVVDIRKRLQFSRLFFGRRIAEEISAADLRPGEVLQQIWLSQRWVKLNVKMKTAVVFSVSRRLTQRHDIWERHSPQIVEFHQDCLQNRREI